MELDEELEPSRRLLYKFLLTSHKQEIIMKTFILFWNPDISSYTLDRLEDDIRWYELNEDFDWSIRDHQLAHEGDRFFMVRCKNKPVPGKLNEWGKQVWEPFVDNHTGVCMSGTFTSEPFRGEDWSGKGREVFYMKMHLDVALNPDKMPLLKAEDLIKDIPGFDWKGGASGRLINEDWANRLAALWTDFLKTHKSELENSSDDFFIEDELLQSL